MIGKIENMSNHHFKSRVAHVKSISEHMPRNPEIMYTLEILDEAISKGRQVSFTYNSYGTDKKLHPRREEPYLINPYQIVAVNDKYYLICNVNKYDNVAHFRLDRITNIKLLKEKVKSRKKVKGMENGLCLPKHMAEHIYMFSGESVAVKLKTTEDMMTELVDWFGTGITILEKNDDEIMIRVVCNEKAMRYWALQYGPYVEVISPPVLRSRIAEDVEAMAEKYGKE